MTFWKQYLETHLIDQNTDWVDSQPHYFWLWDVDGASNKTEVLISSDVNRRLQSLLQKSVMKNAKHILSTMLHVIYLAHGQYSKTLTVMTWPYWSWVLLSIWELEKKIFIPFVWNAASVSLFWFHLESHIQERIDFIHFVREGWIGKNWPIPSQSWVKYPF